MPPPPLPLAQEEGERSEPKRQLLKCTHACSWWPLHKDLCPLDITDPHTATKQLLIGLYVRLHKVLFMKTILSDGQLSQNMHSKLSWGNHTDNHFNTVFCGALSMRICTVATYRRNVWQTAPAMLCSKSSTEQKNKTTSGHSELQKKEGET